MKSRDEIISLLRRYKPTAQEKYGINNERMEWDGLTSDHKLYEFY